MGDCIFCHHRTVQSRPKHSTIVNIDAWVPIFFPSPEACIANNKLLITNYNIIFLHDFNFYTKNGLSMTNHIYSMAKLADLRSNLSKEEREEYEKFRSNPSKMKDDDKSASSSKSASAEDKGSFKQSFILFRQDYYHFLENVILRRLKDFSP